MHGAIDVMPNHLHVSSQNSTSQSHAVHLACVFVRLKRIFQNFPQFLPLILHYIGKVAVIGKKSVGKVALISLNLAVIRLAVLF